MRAFGHVEEGLVARVALGLGHAHGGSVEGVSNWDFELRPWIWDLGLERRKKEEKRMWLSRKWKLEMTDW